MRLHRAYDHITAFCEKKLKKVKTKSPFLRMDVGVQFEETKKSMQKPSRWVLSTDGAMCFTLSNITTQLDMELHMVGAARR